MKKVTVIIPTRNRKNVLYNTLLKLQGLNDPMMEILVYDDASEEDFTKELKKPFPQIKFMRSEMRVGPCELRNRMIKEASGKYIIGLDDDSYFVDKESYEKATKLIEESLSNVGLIGFKILVKDAVQFPTAKKEGQYLSCEFLASGFIAKKSMLLQVGGFDSFIMRAGEERDLAIRILDAGWDILQVNDIEIFHEYSPLAREHQFIHSYAFRNELFFYLKYFPGLRCPLFIFKCFLSHTFFCFKKLWFRAYSRGFCGFLRYFFHELKRRKPVKKETVRKYLRLLKGTPCNSYSAI